MDFCEGCVYGKQTQNLFPVGKSWGASSCLELVHTNVCGPIIVDSFGGSRYFLLFIDDYIRISWVYFLKNKSETFDCFKEFKALVEKENENNINVLRSDNGGEFTS